MDWKSIAEKSVHAVREARRSLDELADSDTAKAAANAGKAYLRKGKQVTVDALGSEFAQGVKQRSIDAGETVRRGANSAGEWARDKWTDATAETDVHNWYARTADACEQNADALQGTQDGVSGRLSRGVAAKLGAVSTSAGIFSVASLIGTASTGTAIGTLSGAAFTSASLAWLGGSVVLGTAILGVASLAGGIGAALGTAWAAKKYVYGQARKPEELTEQERKAVDACMALAIAFRKQAEAGKPVDPVSASYLEREALQPLCDLLDEIQHTDTGRPLPARKRCERAARKLSELTRQLRDWSQDHPNITTGVVSVVFLRLLADDLGEFTGQEQLVLEALRRSNGVLADASEEELAEYVQGLDADQLPGLQNNVKGIYHELRFAQAENTDGDKYTAELFEATNHSGSDVRITNLETGEIHEVQLKATNYAHAIQAHNERYDSIDVLATSEVAEATPGVDSSGFSNAELKQDVEGVTDQLDGWYDPGVLDSMAVAGTVALARNVGVLLKGKESSIEERRSLVKDGAQSAGVAGLFSLVLS
ncbi:hypothetical protein E4634_16195 [Mangrovimicrobium sediminis]|uniref:Uncharacterized protein n=1 Tax=Mangrovimicrobium sediminis TaxID=2562682 RepID=A0A4Z0LYF2_9GAMM|nr:hypothetical protein [Haliea sp. SAOS-164]TGD72206.1 hypothetical protein E4634_16195 [Haliea sp. SAOS-164]